MGRIEQVAVDPQSGLILFALIVPFMGYDRLIPVPWERIHLTEDGSSAVIDIPEGRLMEAPTIDRGSLPSWIEDPRIHAIREYYDLGPEPIRVQEQEIRRRGTPVDAASRRGWSSGASWALAVIVVLVVVGGVFAFLFYDQGVSASAASVKAAANSVKDASVDAATTVKVKAALGLSKSVSAYDIDVDTKDGVVTLTGRVPSDEIRGLAAEIAADTSGVARVENRLIVDPTVQADQSAQSDKQPDANRDVKAAVEQALRRTELLSGTIIGVRVADGRVVLEGLVGDTRQKAVAEQAARSVEGVEEVQNNLQVVHPEPEGVNSSEKMSVELIEDGPDPSSRRLCSFSSGTVGDPDLGVGAGAVREAPVPA